MQRVISYVVQWMPEMSIGRIVLRMDDGSMQAFEVDSPAELAALCDILRNERHLAWDPDQKLLTTNWHGPGPGHH